jgi:SAM-dependent methyltransferase
VSSKEQPIETYVAKDYWEKRLGETWGLQGVGYLNLGVPYNEWLYRMRRQVFRRQIAELNLKPCLATVLDIGSGTGFWLEQWKSLGVRSLSGIDIAAVAVERLRKTFPEIDIVQLDIARGVDWLHWTGKFDMISAFDVLFHITNDDRFRRAIGNVSGLLKKGGYFFFSDNFLHGEAWRSDHQVSRSLEQIEGIVIESGFRIVRRVPFFVLMNAPIDCSSRWPLLAWRAFLAPIHFIPFLGSIYGAVLYPIDRALTRLMSESPTTELMICQKS